MTAQANIDVKGRLVRARVRARSDREAVDLLHDRLCRRPQHYLHCHHRALGGPPGP